MSDTHLALARERIGQVLKERWLLEDVLGIGGMAAVYAARHRNGARTAIKVLHGPLSEDVVVRERFLREAYLANTVDHPGVCHVLDDDADPKMGPFLVMELLDGDPILELLEKGVIFDVPAALDIADQTLDVLASAHERGIVHRDLKPANLFLCRNGQVKVLDFGIARILDENQARLTRTGVPLGTPAYMAPEQARGLGREADGRADVYALGATLFRILAGRHVHVGRGAEQIAKVATARAPALYEVAPMVPPIVCAVVDRALEFEPERRYASARAMQSDVRAVRAGHAPPIASRPLPPPGPVPGLPPLMPKKGARNAITEDVPRDAQVALAESMRLRAHEVARRPDAFTAHFEGPLSTGQRAAIPSRAYEEDDDDNMPTLAVTPGEMELGPPPKPVREPVPQHVPPAPRSSPHPPVQAPRPPPSTPMPPPPTKRPVQTVEFGSAPAQVFARIPNVPVPQSAPPSYFNDDQAATEKRVVAPGIRSPHDSEVSSGEGPTMTVAAPSVSPFAVPSLTAGKDEPDSWVHATQVKLSTHRLESARGSAPPFVSNAPAFVPPPPSSRSGYEPNDPRASTPNLAPISAPYAAPPSDQSPQPAPSRSRWPLLLVLLLVICAAVAAGMFLAR